MIKWKDTYEHGKKAPVDLTAPLQVKICTFQMPVNDILFGEHEYNTLKALKQAFRDCSCDIECSDIECTDCVDTECPGLGPLQGPEDCPACGEICTECLNCKAICPL